MRYLPVCRCNTLNDGYTYCPQSHMNFGPVVKPLGITVKKDSGKVGETSGEGYVVRPLPTREL